MNNWRRVIWIGFVFCINFSLYQLTESQAGLSIEKRWYYGRDIISGQPPTEEATDLLLEVTLAFEYAGDIYTTDFQSDPVSITNSNTYEMIPAWSPDGSQIAFLFSASSQTGDESLIHVITLSTGEIRQLSELEFTSETSLNWSPDGRYIAATLGTIFIVDIEDQKTRRLPVDCGMCSVNWLPDSSGLIFQSSGEIFRIDVHGENLQQITYAPPNTFRPALSPVSDEVVFQSTDEDIPGLYDVNLDDLEINPVVELTGYDIFAHDWSPDGEHIAFDVFQTYGSEVDVPGGGDVYVVNKDGTELRAITGDGYDVLIGWSSDSQHVIYYEKEPGGASGSYFAVNITDETQTRLSGEVMDSMCSYSNCHNFTIRP